MSLLPSSLITYSPLLFCEALEKSLEFLSNLLLEQGYDRDLCYPQIYLGCPMLSWIRDAPCTEHYRRVEARV